MKPLTTTTHFIILVALQTNFSENYPYISPPFGIRILLTILHCLFPDSVFVTSHNFLQGMHDRPLR